MKQDRTQAIGLCIQSGTNSQLYATPAAVRPPAASIHTGTVAQFTELAFRDLLISAWKQTGQSSVLTLLLGESLKKTIDDWAQRVVDATANLSILTRSSREYDSKVLGYEVQTYRTPFGTAETHLSRWLAHENFGGTAAKAKWRGYGIHPDRWQLLWNTQPRVERLAFQGGSYRYGAYGLWMLACL